MQISLILISHNRQNFLPRALNSLLAQTYHDFELLIIENGSTDLSPRIAAEYQQQDRRIKLYRQPTTTIAAARKRGLELSQGQYIAFFDDDDYAEPDFLHFLLNLAQENEADCAICGVTGRKFAQKMQFSAEEAILELLKRQKYTVGLPAKLWRRQLFEGLDFPLNKQFDDIWLTYHLLAKAKKVAYHGLLKYHISRHGNNNSAWTDDYSLLNKVILSEYIAAYSQRHSFLCKRFPAQQEAFIYYHCSFLLSMLTKIDTHSLSNCQEQRLQILAILAINYPQFKKSPYLSATEKANLQIYEVEICQK